MVFKRSKIGTRLAVLVGLIGLSLAILQSALMAYFDLQSERERVQESTREMLASASKSAARAVFELNQKAAQEIVNGLLYIDYIVLGRVSDELGNTLAESKKDNYASAMGSIFAGLLTLEAVLLIAGVSIFTAFLFPGFGGLLVWHQAAMRLRLYKYDYLEENPGANRKKIPWDGLLVEEKEKVGKRTLRGMIFPWKE